nr:hypothetical protein [Nocardiopsis sp. CNR-923]
MPGGTIVAAARAVPPEAVTMAASASRSIASATALRTAASDDGPPGSPARLNTR